MERLFTAYTVQRDPEETFLSFTRRHSIDELKAFCATESVVPLTTA
jgi:ferredoxin-nitrite reductase